MVQTERKIGPFQVIGTLGTGAHSTILHIRRSADGRQYALKVVPITDSDDLKFLEQAEHEYRVSQKLDHINLIKVYILEKHRAWKVLRIRELRLLIEYVNGRTLDKFGVLPIPKLVQIFQHVAAGLAHMHRRDVCHADLKPNNIMLSRTGDVKIIDYGLAWIKGENKRRVQGTPEYMAPEQAKNRVVNEQTDIFNFGATMYRLCTWRHIPQVAAQGSLPLTAKSWQAMLKPVREGNPNVPPSLANLIEHCLAYQPQQRIERVSDIQATLDRLVHDLVKSPEDSLEALEWQE
jgi:serine/threonine protein kinase